MAIQVGYTIFKIDNPFFYPETSELSDSLANEVEGIGVWSAMTVAMSKRQARNPYPKRASLAMLCLANEVEGNKVCEALLPKVMSFRQVRSPYQTAVMTEA